MVIIRKAIWAEIPEAWLALMPTVALIGPELFPIPPLHGGAAELFIDKVAAHLSRWRPLVIGPGDPDLPRRETRGRVEYWRIPLTGARRWLYKRYGRVWPWYDRQVAAILRSAQPDLLHVHNRPNLALNLKKWLPRLPVILHMHNLYDILGKRERPRPGTPIPVEGFVACSRFVLEKERNRLGLGAAAHFVVYNGVDPQAFAPPGQDEARVRRVRQQYGLNQEPTVLFVGKLRESKGVGLLLQAMHRVWGTLPQAALVLVGGSEFGRGRTGRETPFLRELPQQIAGAPGKVILTGFIPPEQIPPAYLLGDIFVGPSQNEEGLGIVFLEASASGLPIIATRKGGIPEVVQEGLNGLLLDNYDDARELGEKILRLLQDRELAQRLGQQGRDWVCQNFSWKRIAARQEEVYDEVMGGGG
ncbi:MAG: glycosyltransferase family 4 protein [Thermodesulfobacteriota bacterium]